MAPSCKNPLTGVDCTAIDGKMEKKVEKEEKGKYVSLCKYFLHLFIAYPDLFSRALLKAEDRLKVVSPARRKVDSSRLQREMEKRSVKERGEKVQC